MEELTLAFRAKAKLVHPANGGTKELFKLVSDCFNQLRTELSNASRQDMDSKDVKPAPPALFSADGKLDMEKFNQVFESTRLPDPYQEGYGKFMEPSTKNREEFDIPKVMDKFDSIKFNKIFDDIEDDDKHAYDPEADPEPFLVGGASCGELGGSEITDFTGVCNNLMFSDYMKAHTRQKLINPRIVNARPEFKSVEDLIKHREDDMFKITVNQAYKDRIALKDELNERMENERIKRLMDHDLLIQKQWNAV